MKPMQRQFGKLMSKGGGDTAKVSVLLNDYEDADKMLTKVRAPTSISMCLAVPFEVLDELEGLLLARVQ